MSATNATNVARFILLSQVLFGIPPRSILATASPAIAHPAPDDSVARERRRRQLQQNPQDHFCGRTWGHAHTICPKPCPFGDDSFCAWDHSCFQGTGCVGRGGELTGPLDPSDDPTDHFFCGYNETDANEHCRSHCPTGIDTACPYGMYCFQNTRCDARSSPPSDAPTRSPSPTQPPTKAPSDIRFPTKAPTSPPTDAPTKLTTTASPTVESKANPSSSPPTSDDPQQQPSGQQPLTHKFVITLDRVPFNTTMEQNTIETFVDIVHDVLSAYLGGNVVSKVEALDQVLTGAPPLSFLRRILLHRRRRRNRRRVNEGGRRTQVDDDGGTSSLEVTIKVTMTAAAMAASSSSSVDYGNAIVDVLNFDRGDALLEGLRDAPSYVLAYFEKVENVSARSLSDESNGGGASPTPKPSAAPASSVTWNEAPDDDGGDESSLPLGLVIGLSVAVLVTFCLLALCLRKRNQDAAAAKGAFEQNRLERVLHERQDFGNGRVDGYGTEDEEEEEEDSIFTNREQMRLEKMIHDKYLRRSGGSLSGSDEGERSRSSRPAGSASQDANDYAVQLSNMAKSVLSTSGTSAGSARGGSRDRRAAAQQSAEPAGKYHHTTSRRGFGAEEEPAGKYRHTTSRLGFEGTGEVEEAASAGSSSSGWSSRN